MDLDDREARLRSRFAWTMGWTALAVLVPGWVLGTLLQALSAGAGVSGRLLAGETAAMIGGHVLAGLAVVGMLVRSYLAPCRTGATGDGP